jgi:tRNA(fMet)-specific endonuclease VapC
MVCLDTNTCVYFLKGTYRSILEEFRKRKPEEIKIPSMVKAELLLGVEKSAQKEKNLELVNKFLEPFGIISFDSQATEVYANIRASLEKKGKLIGPNDLIIAATTLAHKGILVTHNTKEFKQVSGLHLEDWIRETKK